MSACRRSARRQPIRSARGRICSSRRLRLRRRSCSIRRSRASPSSSMCCLGCWWGTWCPFSLVWWTLHPWGRRSSRSALWRFRSSSPSSRSSSWVRSSHSRWCSSSPPWRRSATRPRLVPAASAATSRRRRSRAPCAWTASSPLSPAACSAARPSRRSARTWA